MKKNYTDAAARVAAMSRAMTRVQKAVDALNRDMDRLEKMGADVAALDDYQRSGLWLKDFEADEAGSIPADVNRAVLSEDGLYNLLQEWEKLKKIIR
ncbi:MAG: DUF4298 domain-containing protein [Bacteroidales bacterium]|nr:DUF4298 domain-containing protein [Bacteroidales bacterium]